MLTAIKKNPWIPCSHKTNEFAKHLIMDTPANRDLYGSI